MTTLENKLRKQLTIRPSILVLCVLALGSLAVGPAVGAGTSAQHKVTMISDDVYDTVVPDELDELPVPGEEATGDDGNGNGNGNGNNGHGNNEDGVDSSNPGQGHGGPNGQVDESCPDENGECVDDESGNGNGNGNGNGHP